MYQEARVVRFWPVIAALVFGSFLSTLSTTGLNVAIPVLMRDLHAELAMVQWTVTGLMMAVGGISPITGYLGDRFGYKRLYCVSLIGFTVASGLCAVAWNVGSLIAFRVMQGLFCGLIIPATMAIIYQVLPPDRQSMGISLWTMASMLAPAVAPTVSGWLIDHYGWHAIFWLNIPIGLVGTLMVAQLIPNDHVSGAKSFDAEGFLTGVVGSVSLLVGLTNGGTWGWLSGRTLGLATVGILALSRFIRRELTTAEPVLNLRVFTYPQYTISVVVNAIVLMGLYGGMLLAPIYLQKVQLISPFESGLILLPGSLIMAALMPLVGKLNDLVSPRTLVVGGILLFAVGSLAMSRLTPSTPSNYVMLWMTVRYIGLAFTTSPVTNTGMTAVPRKLSGHASSMNNWVRQGFAALGVGLFSTLLATRTAAHSATLSGTTVQTARAALTLAVDDLFVVAMVISLIGLLFSFFLRRRRTAEPHTPDLFAPSISETAD